MKIKYITNVRIPTTRAHGYAIMKMCEEFGKAGVETKLYIPKRGNTQNKKDPFDYYKIERTFELNRVSSFDLLGTTPKFGKFFYWLDTLSFLIAAKLKVKLDKGDVLYTRDYMTILFFSSHKINVLELHDISSSNFLFKSVLKKVKVFFVLNNNLKADLVSLGVAKEKIFISPSGVDLKDFNIALSKQDLRNKLDLPQDKKIVLYTGQFYEWKGVGTLAEAAKIMPDTTFVFVGGAEPELSSFIRKCKNVTNIIVKSFQERSEIAKFLSASDVLVIPNSGNSRISSHYTSPLKLFEYMASKRPIIASDLPSIREVLSEEECVFASPDNPKSFTDAINKILVNPALAEKISLNSYNKVLKYSWHERAHKIIEKINQAI